MARDAAVTLETSQLWSRQRAKRRVLGRRQGRIFTGGKFAVALGKRLEQRLGNRAEGRHPVRVTLGTQPGNALADGLAQIGARVFLEGIIETGCALEGEQLQEGP